MQYTGIREKHWAISKNWSDYLGLPPQCSIICQISFYQEANNEQNIAFPISRTIFTWSSDSFLNFYHGFDCETVTWHKGTCAAGPVLTQSVFMFWDYYFLNMLIMLPALTESCGGRVEEPCKQGSVRRGNRDKEETDRNWFENEWRLSHISGWVLRVHLCRLLWSARTPRLCRA